MSSIFLFPFWRLDAKGGEVARATGHLQGICRVFIPICLLMNFIFEDFVWLWDSYVKTIAYGCIMLSLLLYLNIIVMSHVLYLGAIIVQA
jgi:hypothetical protein